MSSTASICSWGRILPSIYIGLGVVLLFQLTDGGVTVASLFLRLFICVSFALLCLFVGFVWFLTWNSSPKMNGFDTLNDHSTHISNFIDKAEVHFSRRPSAPVHTRRAVISHNMDKALKEVFDYIYRDYILSWFAPLSRDEEHLHQMLSGDFWEIVRQLRNRLADVDVVNMVCTSIVKALHSHFCNLKAANTRQEEPPKAFTLHPCLCSPEEELHFLRCCSRLLLLFLLPVHEARSNSLRLVLVEVLATKVLKPLAELLSDPDYINRMLLAQLELREQLNEHHKKAYTYAPSYEEFIKLINGSSDVDFLKQLRYQIVVEIIQTTTISSLPQLKKQKDSKGKEMAIMKAELLRARNMKRYINQLTVAKKQCEKRIRLLGGPNYAAQEDRPADETDGPQSLRIYQFEEIMSNSKFRGHFCMYMEQVDKRVLIDFWEQVEMLKIANKTEVPQLVGEIYQNYFVESRQIPVEKALYKEIQQTLVGNKGTEVFHKLQGSVQETMKEHYYPSFLMSDQYEWMVKHEEQFSSSQSSSEDKDEMCKPVETGEEALDEGGNGLSEQATYAASKLRQLCEKLEYKRQALWSIQNAPKPDKKIVSRLKEEISAMEKEHSDLKLHISRTDWWCEKLGMWRAFIISAETIDENGEQMPCYTVSVSLQDGDNSTHSRWTVTRKLSEFQVLHRKLSECFPSLKKIHLPSLSKLPFKSVDLKFLEKSKSQLNPFLQKMLSDERMCQSEALYAFLSPSPEHLKVIDLQKKPSFSLASFLEKLPGDFFSHQEEETDDDSDFSDYGDEVDGKKDVLAEPFFMLIGEIFELRGMFKWVRKTLIALVQVTFGKTINKQIRDTVTWIFSEQMLVYYITVFRDAFWPNGNLASHSEARSDFERRATKERAQQKLLDNIPDALQSLVGQQNARYGIIKIFNSLQETKANKHLLYVLLEIFLKELYPELRLDMSQIYSN